MSLYTATIQQLYVAYFSRPADVAGLVYWENIVAGAKGDTSAVSAAFATSAEYQAAYAGKTAAEVIDKVYMNLFGRHAEADGLAYWSSLLAKGALSVDVIVTAVAGGSQGTDRVAYNSKVAAATAFTAALDTSAEILGYSGALAISRAIAFIAGVTTPGQLDAATSPSALDATVRSVTGTSLPVPDAPPTVPTPKPVPTPVVPTPTPTPTPEPGSKNINLGPGDNRLGDITVAPGDVIDGGAGFDTLSLDQVTPLNVMSFWNFERLETTNPRKLDMDGFTGRNNISEILVSAGEIEAGMELFNIGADTNVRITGDGVGIQLHLAALRTLTLTIDIDEKEDPAAGKVTQATLAGASDAKVVFDTDFKFDRGNQVGADENLLNSSYLALSSDGLTSIHIDSGGDHARNHLLYSTTSEVRPLETVTIGGARHLTLQVEGASLVDASASSGGLTVSTRYLADGALIKLGSGTDTITVSNNSTTTNPESIAGLEKTAAIALSTAPADGAAASAAVAAADTLRINGARVADSTGGDYSGASIERGVLTFTGKGPGSVSEAFAIAAQVAESEGEAVLFAFLDNSYLYVREWTDMGVKLVGLTGVTALVDGPDGYLFVV